MGTLWDPPLTLTTHQLEGLPVIGRAHGPTHPKWSPKGQNRTRYSVHVFDPARNKLLVSVGSIVIGHSGCETPHPQRGVTGWAPVTAFDLAVIVHERTRGPYAGLHCHHHLSTYPEARPCWHCKARPPDDGCTYFTPSEPPASAEAGPTGGQVLAIALRAVIRTGSVAVALHDDQAAITGPDGVHLLSIRRSYSSPDELAGFLGIEPDQIQDAR
ncbi:hypothetical protein [Streptomyces misionensis]|uniref:hypothetical protein n=1 Tax=Streptomyces misionensis TaxID=67331 RepID=UPI00339DE948